MVRFCDKEIITMTMEDYKTFDKMQIAVYFLDEKSKECPILLYDNEGKYYGMISYESCCSDEAIVRDYFIVGESFWDEAGNYFEKNPKEEMPVFDESMNLLSFCYCDKNVDSTVFTRLSALDELIPNIPVSILDKYEVKLICIHDLNEFAWKSYQLFVKCGYPVFVTGEGWGWFGVKNEYNPDSYFMRHKMHIYAEGKGYVQKKGGNIGEEFGYLRSWTDNVYAKLYTSVINEMLDSNVKVCKVMIPEKTSVDVMSLPKNELLNYFRPIPIDKISSNVSVKYRQRDFLGEEEYINIESGSSDDNDWSTVFPSEVKCEKIQGVKERRRIYLIGACIVASEWMLAKNSLVAQLQKWVGKYEYEVVNFVIPTSTPNKMSNIRNIPIREKDICIFVHNKNWFDGTGKSFVIDLTDVYNKPRFETWTSDGIPIHTNAVANKVIAKEIFYRCLDAGIIEKDDMPNNKYIQKGEILSLELQQPIFAYADSLKQYSYNVLNSGEWQLDKANGGTKTPKIGSIVMNCNPFTKGHQYLIEQAASQVDYLYIFVVQEDKSFFTFDDRFELVKAGTSHLNNVIVVPSGEHVLSYKTLPVYFEKEEQKTAKVDATQDVEIFARYIAPHLGITCRFAGEEPIDMVTKQYNEQMVDILPQFDIEFIEIPRKVTDSDNEVISASRVRRLMKEDKWEELRELVPDTTYDYLLKKYADRDTLL